MSATPPEKLRDEVFNSEIQKPSDFRFEAKVVRVFDDMVNRSVPFYEEIQRMTAELAASHAQPGTLVYDLGCSTGNTLINMDACVEESIGFVGIDDSPEMLARCREKLELTGAKRPYDLQLADLSTPIALKNASVVVLCLTLQFVRPLYREKLLRRIAENLVPGGVLILVEKILAEEASFNRDFIDYYYDMKRRHQYSEMEIAQKREALENVLIPYKLSENLLLLKEAGFGHSEIFFKWYNFAGIIAQKK